MDKAEKDSVISLNGYKNVAFKFSAYKNNRISNNTNLN